MFCVQVPQSRGASHQRLQGGERTLSDFRSWVERVAKSTASSPEKEILLLYTSDDYVGIAVNCAKSLTRLGVENVGILVVSDIMEQFLQSHNLSAFNVASLADIPADIRLDFVKHWNDTSRMPAGWSSRFTLPTRWRHWMLRHYLTLVTLKMGVGVFQSDVDVIFMQDPYNWVDGSIFDIEAQTQNFPSLENFNLGIGHVSPTFGGVLHWETTNNLMRYLGQDPQSLENTLLFDRLSNLLGSWESRPCRVDSKFTCQTLHTPFLTARKWNAFVFPHTFELESKLKPLGMLDASGMPKECIGIHMHVKSGPATGHYKTLTYKEWAQEHNLWFISPKVEKRYEEILKKK